MVVKVRISLAIIFKYGLKDGDLNHRNFDNQQLGLVKIVNKYLREKILMFMIDCFIFEKSNKNLANIDNKINITMFNFEKSSKKLANMDNKINIIIAGLLRRGVRLHADAPTHMQKCLDM